VEIFAVMEEHKGGTGGHMKSSLSALSLINLSNIDSTYSPKKNITQFML